MEHRATSEDEVLTFLQHGYEVDTKNDSGDAGHGTKDGKEAERRGVE